MTDRPTSALPAPARCAALAVLVAFAVILGTAVPASAGGDPYGTTTTTQPPSENPACSASPASAAPGARVDVTVTGVSIGSEVRVLLNGDEVGRDTVEPEGSSATGTAHITFTVPNLADGSYSLTASSATFTKECGANGRFEVLGATAGRRPTGPLARTGVQIALLLAVGLALVVGGRATLTAARARRRRMRRATGRHSARA